LAKFKIQMRGRVYSRWPEEKKDDEIELARCLFRRGDSEFQFTVETYVDAISKDDAENLGRERCIIATDLFSFLIGDRPNQNAANLDLTQISRWSLDDEDRTKTCSLNYNMACSIVNPVPLSKEQFDAINLAENAIHEFKDESNSLLRSIRWRALGQQDFEDKLDRFTKLYISLETLAGNENKIPKILHEIYPDADIDKLREFNNTLKEVRSVIFHEGARQQEEIGRLMKKPKKVDFNVCLDLLERVLFDMLRHKLNLPQKYLLKKYL